MGKVFTITTPESELQTHWFSSAEYFEGRGEVEFTFDPKLKPFLLQLKERFTTFRLKEAIQLKSSFAIRMLELLRQYEKLGERVIEIWKLRKFLGIGEDQYKLYADFKKRVILSAQKELTAKTNISFDFEEIKNGHAVDKLRFMIRHIKREALPPVEVSVSSLAADPELQRLLQILPEAYREKDSIRKLLSVYLKKSGFDFVARNIEYANEGSNAVKPGANISKGSNYRNYLAKALNGDFGLPHKEDKETKKEAEESARRKAQEEATAQKQWLEQSQNKKENHERARVFQQSLPPEALEQLKAEAFSRLDAQHQEMVKRKATGSEMMLRIMMDKISLERMKIF